MLIYMRRYTPQYKQITESLALCWIHDARHYKKLAPQMPWHENELKTFMDGYWDFYHKLLDYKQAPKNELVEVLTKAFETLFTTKTGYTQLDERIEKTNMKQVELLMVLLHPGIPLHNNGSELGARVQARYRDISLHNINETGVEIKDTFMTIVETAKKLSINLYDYFYDRISGQYNMPSLADMIIGKSQVALQNTG